MTDALLQIGFDTSPLIKAQAEADKTASKLIGMADAAEKSGAAVSGAAQATAQGLGQISKAAADAGAAQEKAAAGAKALGDETTNQAKKATQQAEETKKQTAAAQQLDREFATLSQALAANVAALQQQGAAAQRSAADQSVLDRALKANKITTEQHATMTAALRRGYADTEPTTKKLGDAVKGMATEFEGSMQSMAGGMPVIGGTIGKVTQLAGAFGPVGIGIGAFTAATIGSVYALSKAQDQMSQYEGQLKNTLGSIDMARDVMKSLADQAQQTGTGFYNNVEAFGQVARNADALGASNDQLMRMTDTIAKLGVVSGASKNDISGAMLQLSQSLSAGTLNGDELNVIKERMPALAKAIAEGLGVQTGALKAMGASGELSAKKVFDAILAYQGKANAQFSEMPDTTERAFQRVEDQWSIMLANMGKATQSSQFIQGILGGVNALMETISATKVTVGTSEAEGALKKLEADRASAQERVNRFGAAEKTSDPLKRLFSGNEREKAEQDLREIDRQIEVARGKAAKEAKDREEAKAAEAIRPETGALSRGSAAAGNQDTLTKSRTQLEAQIKEIEGAQAAIATGKVTATDKQKRTMAEALVSLRQKLDESETAVEKLVSGSADYREQLRIGGTGGGLDLVKQAQDAAKASRGQGRGVSTQGALQSVISDKVAKLGEEVAGMDRQTAAQERLTAGIGATAEATREAELAQAALDYRIKNFGTLTGPLIEKAVDRYTAAMRRSKDTADALADAKAWQSSADKAQVVQAGMAAASMGEYAKARAEIEVKAEHAERDRKGSGVITLFDFDVQQAAAVTQQIDGLDKRITAAQDKARQLNSVDARQADKDRSIEEQVLKVAPDQRDKLRSKLRAADEAEVTASLAEQSRSMDDQIKANEEQLQLLRLVGDELTVQQAKLAKRAELIKAGVVDPLSDAGKAQIDQAGDVAASGARLERARTEAETFKGIWRDSAAGISGSISDAFIASFDEAKKASDVLQESLHASFKSTAKKLMDMALKPAEDALARWVTSGLTQLATGSFGGGGDAGPGEAMAALGQAKGGAYAAGGERYAFAKGGAFTNGIYDQPTPFRFAAGGAMLPGVMGERAAEAIMPLHRGSDGSLGVMMRGGAAQTVQPIMVNVQVDAGGGTKSTASGGDAGQGKALGDSLGAAIRSQLIQEQRPGGLLYQGGR